MHIHKNYIITVLIFMLWTVAGFAISALAHMGDHWVKVPAIIACLLFLVLFPLIAVGIRHDLLVETRGEKKTNNKWDDDD